MSTQTDVAMFIDWENMYQSISSKAKIAELRETAAEHGRLVLAKAYGDWHQRRFRKHSRELYRIGIEPVYVPSDIKNNADVKLATDCIAHAYQHPNIGTFVLVTGDGDFVHIVNALRPLGKKVIAVAQFDNVSARLGDMVDSILIYETDEAVEKDGSQEEEETEGSWDMGETEASHRRRKINRRESVEETDGWVESEDATAMKSNPRSIGAIMGGRENLPEKVQAVYEDIADLIWQQKGLPILLDSVKQKLNGKYGQFRHHKYGFDSFKDFIFAGAEAEFYRLHALGTNSWLILPLNYVHLLQRKAPSELKDVYQDLICIIRASEQSEIPYSDLKQALLQNYQDFDERFYGCHNFTAFMQEGQRRGHFQLTVNAQGIDCAMIHKNELEALLHESLSAMTEVDFDAPELQAT